MFDHGKNNWKEKGWVALAAEFLGNLNRMMALKVEEQIKEKKKSIGRKILGFFLILLGSLILFSGLAMLISSAIGLSWSGPVIIGGGLVIISLLLFKI